MAEKIEVEFEGVLPELARALRSSGVLLACEADGKSNLMTISWGVLGLLWDRPIFGAFVQQSRYTFELLEKAAHFTVNVPPPGLSRAMALCGSASGRQTNKWTASGLTPMSSATVGSPLVAECVGIAVALRPVPTSSQAPHEASVSEMLYLSVVSVTPRPLRELERIAFDQRIG